MIGICPYLRVRPWYDLHPAMHVNTKRPGGSDVNIVRSSTLQENTRHWIAAESKPLSLSESSGSAYCHRSSRASSQYPLLRFLVVACVSDCACTCLLRTVVSTIDFLAVNVKEGFTLDFPLRLGPWDREGLKRSSLVKVRCPSVSRV